MYEFSLSLSAVKGYSSVKSTGETYPLKSVKHSVQSFRDYCIRKFPLEDNYFRAQKDPQKASVWFERRQNKDVWIYCFVGRERSEPPDTSTWVSFSQKHQEENLKLLLICSRTYLVLNLKSFQSILLQQISHFRCLNFVFFTPPAINYLKKTVTI